MTASSSPAGKETERAPTADFRALPKSRPSRNSTWAPHGDGQPVPVDAPAAGLASSPNRRGGEGSQEHEQPVARRYRVGDGEDLHHPEDGRSATS